MNKRTIILLFLPVLLTSIISAQQIQIRDYRIHKRGTLWETVYNTGEIGRAYDKGTGGSEPGKPSFEWPGNSATVVDGKPYNGQYNSFGGGLYLAANSRDTSRLYALCGASDVAPRGTYSFPLSIDRYENYPLTPDGSINTSFNPDEAEERIVAKWGTNLGITVTRTSRAWSNPDYDDFIIYEYELEHTGDRYQSDFSIVHSDATLTDVLVSFVYGLTPSMFGYERTFNQWRNTDYEQHDARARFDRRRWMSYAIDRDGKPDLLHFAEWASSGANGGGLGSPQAVGYVILYCDTAHLAHRGESLAPVSAGEDTIVWDANMHFKQPFAVRLSTGVLTYVKATQEVLDILPAWIKNGRISNRAAYPGEWIGRGSFNWRQSQKAAIGRSLTFGPYIMKHGEKIRFALAEVAGYGAANHAETVASFPPNGKNKYDDEGGSVGELGSEPGAQPELYANNPIPCWDTLIYYGSGGDSKLPYGSTYLKTYKLPDYVNSDVVTIRDVANRAIQAYVGGPVVNYDSTFYWPEKAPDHGVYKLALAVPAPLIKVTTDSLPRNRIEWGPQVDILLQGYLSHFEVFRSQSAIGPWQKIDSVGSYDPRFYVASQGGSYVYQDFTAKLGEYYYYSVVAVDKFGVRSPRSNAILHETQVLSSNAGTVLKDVYVVPNPFLVRSGFHGAMTPDSRICFMNLPAQCTIRIYSYVGQLVNTIEHSSDHFGRAWYQVTRNNQQIAPGLYFFVVETPTRQRAHGKFVVIR